MLAKEVWFKTRGSLSGQVSHVLLLQIGVSVSAAAGSAASSRDEVETGFFFWLMRGLADFDWIEPTNRTSDIRLSIHHRKGGPYFGHEAPLSFGSRE